MTGIVGVTVAAGMEGRIGERTMPIYMQMQVECDACGSQLFVDDMTTDDALVTFRERGWLVDMDDKTVLCRSCRLDQATKE